MKKVIIDPRSNIVYGSFYIYGLIKIFGKRNIHFNARPFSKLPEIGFNLRFVIEKDESVKRYFISTDDSYMINEEMYEWCDIYGNVNANFEKTPKEKYPKLISLAPSFGIRCFSFSDTLCFSVSNLIKCWKTVVNRSVYNKYSGVYECNKFKNIKRYVFDYFKCYFKRCIYDEYEPIKNSNDNYVFFLSTLWYSNKYNNDEGVNLRRSRFIRACKSVENLVFEGGLIGDNSSSNDIFSDVLAGDKVKMKEWMIKTKRSSFVFNTPAFWDCHGWKLGEYMAMGKCMISTRLSNDLPESLVHETNIHFVENNEDSIKKAIEFILANPEYKKRLEQGAREYWNKYGTPEKSLELLGII